jgi:hypothetical protein
MKDADKNRDPQRAQKRALADARCAWRKMDDEQRTTFLAWILEEADASGVGYGLVSIEQKSHGVPFRRWKCFSSCSHILWPVGGKDDK